MEYTKRRRYTVNVETNDLQDIYQHDLQLYDCPPTGEIPFVEFQQLGMERLKHCVQNLLHESDTILWGNGLSKIGLGNAGSQNRCGCFSSLPARRASPYHIHTDFSFSTSPMILHRIMGLGLKKESEWWGLTRRAGESVLPMPEVRHSHCKNTQFIVLQHVESNAVRTELKLTEDRKKNLSTSLGKDGLKHFVHLLYASGCKLPSEADLQCRKKDHLSHYIMRLSHCQDPDRQMWFINQEVELFKLRFSSLDSEGIKKLLSSHNIDCQQITKEEKDEIREELHSSTAKIASIDTSEFYKVPFQRVADLIKSRRVYLTNGMAYIPQTDLMSLFVSYFRKILVDGMEYAKNYVSNISDDERLISFLKSLPGSFSGMTRVVWTSNTTPVDKLDELSKTSYPLCMRTLHEALRTQHHLRNSGRIQYGLFIKGIGVTMEDAVRFWRTEFTKKIDPDKFDKQYAYTIRHTYGKEGKQTNYTPLGCTRIITSSVGPGEYHGCPYRHMDQEALRQKLSGYSIPAVSVNEIADLAKNGHYLIACTKYFEVLHSRLPDKPFVHPNGYFVESRSILAKEEVTEPESQDRFQQSGRLSNTPIRRDRNTGTPARNLDKSIRTPTQVPEKYMTPVREVERTSTTPSRIAKATPKRLDILSLESDEIIAQLMDEDM